MLAASLSVRIVAMAAVVAAAAVVLRRPAVAPRPAAARRHLRRRRRECCNAGGAEISFLAKSSAPTATFAQRISGHWTASRTSPANMVGKSLKSCRRCEATQTVDHHMLQEYYKVCPPPPPGKRASKGSKFDVVQFMEQHESASGMLYDSVGTLMWEGQWIEFAKSAAGGYKSESLARAEWEDKKSAWEKCKDSFVWDLKSPDQIKPLRLRIVKEDLAIARTSQMHRKIINMAKRG